MAGSNVHGDMSVAVWDNTQVMINYKIAIQKGNQKALHFNHFSQVKLPLLDKKITENMKKSLSKIKSGKLPLLHFHETSLNSHQNKRNAAASELENPTEFQPEPNSNFAHLIEQKMNEITNKNHLFNMDYYTNEAENFEQNIARNKEYLKQQREKRASFLNKRKQSQGQSPKQDHNRRITENLKKRDDRVKFASKGKKRTDSPAIANSRSQSLLVNNDEQGEKKKASPGKGTITNRLQKKMMELKKKLSKRKIGHESKLVTEGDAQQANSENLFDNIHNYLANPQRLSFDLKNITTSSKLTSKRSALQAKIKAIQQKISSLDRNVQRTPEKPAIINLHLKNRNESDQYGVNEWRRIEFSRSDEKGKNLSMKESNFEKEVNQINILQQRNEHSLEKYLQNQRILFDLKLIKTNSSRQQLQKQFRSK